ncbi:helix-turn-helix domain-containing protein [Streptomyces microflavus]|uniref:helix-turn-helix transcriptional regulator n=1 Tax=Streptomyces microflavus TaxID=1919 RepID=UPI0034419133
MPRSQAAVPESEALKARPTLAEIKSWPATVNVPQAALALGCSPRHLYYLIKRGEAPVKTLPFGRRCVVTTQSLVTLLESA